MRLGCTAKNDDDEEEDEPCSVAGPGGGGEGPAAAAARALYAASSCGTSLYRKSSRDALKKRLCSRECACTTPNHQHRLRRKKEEVVTYARAHALKTEERGGARGSGLAGVVVRAWELRRMGAAVSAPIVESGIVLRVCSVHPCLGE